MSKWRHERYTGPLELHPAHPLQLLQDYSNCFGGEDIPRRVWRERDALLNSCSGRLISVVHSASEC
jgi:hypothetical protein